MNTPIRPAFVIAVAFLFVIAVAFLLAVCILGLRFACDSSDLRKLIQSEYRREQLLRFQKSLHRRSESKEQVVRELIAQQCSLSEAVARWQELDREWLQELDREWPETAIGIAEMYRRLSPDANYYYRLITLKADGLLMGRPEEAAAVLHRLEKDYQQLQRHPAGALNDRQDAATIAR